MGCQLIYMYLDMLHMGESKRPRGHCTWWLVQGTTAKVVLKILYHRIIDNIYWYLAIYIYIYICIHYLPTYRNTHLLLCTCTYIQIDCHVDFRQGLLGHDLSPRHAGPGWTRRKLKGSHHQTVDQWYLVGFNCILRRFYEVLTINMWDIVGPIQYDNQD